MKTSHFLWRPWYVASLVITIVLGGMHPCASGGVKYDLRVVGGGKEAILDTVNQQLQLELFAVVTGVNLDPLDEAFTSGFLSLYSSNLGNLGGNLSAVLTSPFNNGPASPGSIVDLDGDGDLDIGSNNFGPNSMDIGFLTARRSPMQQFQGTLIQGGQEFKLADVTFTVTRVSSSPSFLPVELFPSVPTFTGSAGEAVWTEDGVPYSTQDGGTGALPTVGESVKVFVPEPSVAVLLPLGLLAFSWRRNRTPGRLATRI